MLLIKETAGLYSIQYEYKNSQFYQKEIHGNLKIKTAISYSDLPEIAKEIFKNKLNK